MTFVVTKVQAYGIEAEEALNKRYRQYMILTITAANTDIDLDLGDNQDGSLGTFWNAVDATATGAGALLAIQDIVTRADYFDSFGGNFLDRAQVDPSGGTLQTLISGTTSGGDAAETQTLTGAATGDTVIAVYVSTAATGSITLQAAASSIATADQITSTWTGDPGTTAKLRVTLRKAAGAAVEAGSYTVSYANKTPNITFATTDAPTAYVVVLKWILQPQTAPVEYYAQA
jgi:hypothetical protein